MSPFAFLCNNKKKSIGHALLGRRQGERGVLEDGARLLKEVISSCDGRGCYPVRMFSAKEIEEAIGQPYQTQGFYNDYEGTHEDRQIIIKVAVGCTSRNPDERPEMKEVAQQLEQIERGELPLSSSLLRVQATGSSYSEGFSHGDVSQPRSITLPFDKISSDMDSESIIG
ncbi:hypothetical protein MRB53_001750 [Persea americana]|uniref:Uncharacterized protein n=1 Tax=Persea americana TaxID=3435 RepID=A0ACC2MSJ6_PERAE|nr:hypothetical protein MRB53_001750 [Persea americana]